MPANIWRPAGVNNNWGNSLNWSLLAVPTASDGNPATFDADVLSGPCTTDASAKVCNGINFSAYNNTITMTNQITVSGNVTLGSGMTIAGAAALLVNATSTLTSNTKVWPNALTLNNNVTYTLADNWNVDGLLTLGPSSGTATINNFQITASADLSVAIVTGIATGTTLIVLDGTGTVTLPSGGTGAFRNNLTINTAGTITFAAAVNFYNTGTFTYIAGTVVTTGSTLNNNSIAVTLAVAGITWNAVNLNGNSTITLSENLNLTGLLTLGSSSNNITINGSVINASGGLTQGGTTSIVTGTTNIVLNGTGTVTGTNSAGAIRNNLTINTAGTITFAGTIFGYNTGTFTYTAGTVVVTAGATLASILSTTWNCAAITWVNITLAGSAATHTLTSDLNCSGLLSLGSTTNAVTIDGSFLNTSGGLRYAGTTGIISGTTDINVIATQTLDAPSQTTGKIVNDIVFNAPGGTITVNSVFPCNIGRVGFVAGNIVTANNTWATGGSAGGSWLVGGALVS